MVRCNGPQGFDCMGSVFRGRAAQPSEPPDDALLDRTDLTEVIAVEA